METITASPNTSAELQKVLDKVGTGKEFGRAYIDSDFVQVNSRMYLNDGTVLEAKPGSVWKLIDDAPNLGNQIPILGQRKATVKDLDLRGITYDGNYLTQTKTEGDHGYGFGNFIGLSGLSNATFKNVTVQNTEGDGFRLSSCSNILIEKCHGSNDGHDFIHMKNCRGVDILNVTSLTRANNSVRARHCKDVVIENCRFTGGVKAGSPPIQLENIEGTSENIEVRNCLIQNSLGPGFWVVSNTPIGSTKNIRIHHNIIKNCGLYPKARGLTGLGGIIFDGFSDVHVYNNTFIGCRGYGVGVAHYVGKFAVPGASVYVRNNIFAGTVPCDAPGPRSGTAIANILGTDYCKIDAKDNLFFDNVGDIYNISSTGEIVADPMFIDGDYNISPDSPCVLADGSYIGAKAPVTDPNVTQPESIQLVRLDNGDVQIIIPKSLLQNIVQ